MEWRWEINAQTFRNGGYTMTDEEGKARLDAMIEIEPRGWWSIPLSLPPARRRIRKAIEFDMREHMKQFAESMSGTGEGGKQDGEHKGG